jgi:hypothetical protein
LEEKFNLKKAGSIDEPIQKNRLKNLDEDSWL